MISDEGGGWRRFGEKIKWSVFYITFNTPIRQPHWLSQVNICIIMRMLLRKEVTYCIK